MADFEVEPNGSVEARFTFATVEPLGGISLDRDHDGMVTPGDVEAASEDLRGFLLEGVDVSADGSRCAPTFHGATLSEVDGIVLEASYACRPAAHVEATLYYLSTLPAGHREIARITAGSAVNQAVLAGDRRAIEVAVPGAPGADVAAKRRAHILVEITAGFAVFMIGLFVWRWRATQPR